MARVVLQMRAALAKVDPDDDYEDECSPPPAADNENDADAGAVAGMAYDARSIQQELDEVSQACRERGEATANNKASKFHGASQPPRLRESDLVSFCEAYVTRSVGTEGVAAAVGGASSAAGSGRGPRRTNVLLKDVFETMWNLASAKIVYRMERFRQSIGRYYFEFYGCYFRACWACLVSKGAFRACFNVSRPHAL